MPRSFVIGNGNVLVGYDANYDVRDLFFPYVGMENQSVGNVCRTGFWIDGRFAWVGDDGWERHIGYWGDTLVGDVTLTHLAFGLTVHFEDYVDMVRDYFIRNLRISLAKPAEQVRVFFHHDWWMREQDLGCTVFYEPDHRAVIAYKGDRWALVTASARSVPARTLPITADRLAKITCTCPPSRSLMAGASPR